jgi:hypothetical protein
VQRRVPLKFHGAASNRIALAWSVLLTIDKEGVLMNQRENGMFLYAAGAFSLAMAAVALAPLGCGDDDTGTGGSAGTTATGGSAGAGGSSGAGGSGGSDSDAGDDAAPPGEPCGGFANVACSAPETMYCDFPEKAACGAGDMSGTCMVRPDTCVAGGPSVCGCDGKSYTNACEAHRAGTDENPMGSCTSAR